MLIYPHIAVVWFAYRKMFTYAVAGASGLFSLSILFSILPENWKASPFVVYWVAASILKYCIDDIYIKWASRQARHIMENPPNDRSIKEALATAGGTSKAGLLLGFLLILVAFIGGHRLGLELRAVI